MSNYILLVNFYDAKHYLRSKELVFALSQNVKNDCISRIIVFNEAKKDGVIALFGEKYGDQVRVVSSGDFSKELCGGTHVDRTGGIGLFKITEESSLASGVRRIVAVTGKIALKMFQNKSNTLGKIQLQMNCKEEELSERIGQLYSEKKILEKKIKELIQTNDSDVDSWIKNSQKIGEYSFVIELIDISNVDHLKRSGDKLLSQINSGVGVLFSSDAHKPSAVIVLTDNLIKQGLDAGNLAKEIGSFMGGGGGGKPHLATAGGRDQAQVQNAIEKTRNLILNKLTT